METNFVLEQPAYKTSTFQFLWKVFRNPLQALSDLANEQGDIARVKLRRRDLFLLNHPSFIEEVLVKQADNFIKGPSLQRARAILGGGLLTSEGDEHLSQRRALQPAFHRHKMEEYLPLMNENTLAHIANWKNGERVDMSEGMMRLTLNIALWSFFGSAPEGAVEKVSGAMKTLVRLFPLAQMPLPESARSLFPSFKEAKASLSGVIEALLQNPQNDRALIHILKESRQFTDEQVRAHALTFLLAGHETTALLLAWCWDLLAHHPGAQTKLQTEADAILGDCLPAPEDLEKLVYARAVVKETLRMRPPAWAMGREAAQDCEIGGQFIPAGSTVILSQWVTHHDSRFYDEPLLFRPERWFDFEMPLTPRYSYFPFGGGGRVCIGEHFAMTEAAAILAVVARRWNIAPAQREPALPKPSVTLRPDKNVKVVIARRAVS